MMANNPPFGDAIRLDLAKEVLRIFGEMQFIARGVSMLPSVFPGDMLRVRRAGIGELRAGQVVLYVRSGALYAHRVICSMDESRPPHLITRGDALLVADSPVRESEVLGRVTAVVRGLKTIEFAEEQGTWVRVLRWSVQRSEFAARCLVRSHRSWTRVARKLANGNVTTPAKLQVLA